MPAPNTECFSLLQGETMRATRVDSRCGVVQEGPCATVATDGWISVAMTDNIEAPDEFKQKNAKGRYCYPAKRSDPLLNWIDLVIQFCNVDPELFEMITGSPLVLDAMGNPVGFSTTTGTYATGAFGLELWTGLGSAAGCGPNGDRFGYLLLPFIKQGTLGELTIANAVINFTVNAVTTAPNSWGVGPYDVVLDAMGMPSPLLSPVPTDLHRQVMLTDVAPPEPVCGCTPLMAESPS